MYIKRIIDKTRVRRIPDSFSWIDHRFISAGYIEALETVEIIVYLFLVSVGDRYGLSFYGSDAICRLLKIDRESLYRAREGLLRKSFIRYEGEIYQVLSLPVRPADMPARPTGRTPPHREPNQNRMPAEKSFSQIGEILKEMLS